MRLSMVFELLLIVLLIAFAAYGRVIERDEKAEDRAIRDVSGSEQSNVGISTLSLKQATDNVNRYCTCNENICNCCRDFHIPLVQLQGPGCASLQYLQGDNLAVQLSFGDNILTSTIVNGKNPKPVCVPLPGGFTKFCGRIYSIKRDAKNHFKACLGLELQSATELEASLRVSCFRFGPDGLKLRPAEPLPVVEAEAPEEDDDDDFFGLGSDDDDEDDDAEDNAPLANSVPNSSAEEDEEEDDDEDVLGFGALLDIITGEDETATKKPKVTTPPPLLHFTIPILSKPTSSPVDSNVASNVATNDFEEDNEYNQESSNMSGEGNIEINEESAATDTTGSEAEEIVTQVSNKIASYTKPDKTPIKKFTAVDTSTKKPSITSSSINAIENETNKKKKPSKKPIKGEEDDDDDILEDSLDDDDDDDDEDEEILNDDDDDNEKDSEAEEDEDEKVDGSEHENHEDEDEKGEIEDLDDDDDEEDAVISALVYDEKENGKKKGKVKKHHQSSEAYDDDSDYELGLTGLLARSRHSRDNRQSKEMRF
ncbi:mitotic apparatus protein p62-like [Bombus vosnesenskii]|uniref:Mitotic apparatus protein p62-like n=1 Tax=Bombus vosnesenskii TaxID=207650 RepID=A0A6J3KWU5_9HYME|nr:mitotic apparatus protein p62-like [Bombus vosnesenskii]